MISETTLPFPYVYNGVTLSHISVAPSNTNSFPSDFNPSAITSLNLSTLPSVPIEAFKKSIQEKIFRLDPFSLIAPHLSSEPLKQHIYESILRILYPKGLEPEEKTTSINNSFSISTTLNPYTEQNVREIKHQNKKRKVDKIDVNFINENSSKEECVQFVEQLNDKITKLEKEFLEDEQEYEKIKKLIFDFINSLFALNDDVVETYDNFINVYNKLNPKESNNLFIEDRKNLCQMFLKITKPLLIQISLSKTEPKKRMKLSKIRKTITKKKCLLLVPKLSEKKEILDKELLSKKQNIKELNKLISDLNESLCVLKNILALNQTNEEAIIRKNNESERIQSIISSLLDIFKK